MASIISKMTTAQVAKLTTSQITKLQSSDVAALTPAMIDAMDLNPNDGQFQAFSAAQIKGLGSLSVAALSSTQLNQLATATFAALSNAQIGSIATSQISGIDTTHIKALASTQVSGLTNTEITKLTPTQISNLSTAAVSALSSGQLGAFAAPVDKALGTDVTGTIASLTTAQFAALSVAALPGLDVADITTKDTLGTATGLWLGVTTAQLAALTTKQVTGLATDDVGKFVASQLNALNPDTFAALTTAQIDKIAVAQISGIDADHLAALTAAQAAKLSPAAMAELTATQIASLSTAAVAALTSAQLAALDNGVINGLIDTQVAALSSAAMPGLEAADITSLADGTEASLAWLGALTSNQTKGLATADIDLLTAEQINAIDPTAFAAMSAAQIGAIDTGEIQDIDADHIGALTSVQIPGLSTAAITALDDGTINQVAAFSTSALTALSADQLNAFGPINVATLSAEQFAALPSKALAGLQAEDVIGDIDQLTATSPGISGNMPTLVATSPLDNSTGFAAGDDIVLTFSEDVEAGSGLIQVWDVVANSSFKDIAVAIGDSDGTVTFDGRTVTIDLVADLVGSKEYAIRYASAAIHDLSGEAVTAIADSTTLSFKVAPDLVAISTIIDGVAFSTEPSAVEINDSMTLTFTEAMKAGIGNIIISSADSSDIRMINVNDTNQVSGLPGTAIIINPTDDLIPGTPYYVQMAEGTFVSNAADIPYKGVSDTSTLNFTTGLDTTNPTVVAADCYPLDGATLLAVANSNIIFTFSENVSAVAGKNVTIDYTGLGIDATYDVTDTTHVTIMGKVVTVNPSNFNAADTVTVTFDNGAFKDSSGNDFDGTFSFGTYNFTTHATVVSSDTTLGTVTFSPVDNAPAGAVPALTLTFAGEGALLAGEGSVTIRSDDGSDIRTFDIHDNQVGFATNVVTITPNDILHTNTLYSVQIDNTAIIDAAGNVYAGIADTTTWNFTTANDVPVVDSHTPGTGATGIAPDSNIVLTFNEPVVGITGKSITIGGLSFDALETGSTADAGTVTVIGKVVTIDPDVALTANTAYTVALPAGAFKDVDAASANVLDPGFTFTTADTAPPSSSTLFTNVVAGTNLDLVFAEAVQAGNGQIIVTDLIDDTRIIPVTDTNQVRFDNATVHINPTYDLLTGHDYYVTMGSGAVVDMTGDSYTPAVDTLSTLNWAGLGVDQIGALASAQIAGLSLDVVAAMSPTQVAALTSGAVSALSSAQINALDPSDVAAMSVEQFAAISSTAIAGLEAADAVAIGRTANNTTIFASLTANQTTKLPVEVVAALSSAQVVALSNAAITALSADQLGAVSSLALSKMTGAQFAVITPKSLASLDATDINACNTTQLAALTSTQVVELTTTAIASLDSVQIAALTTKSFAALTTAQIEAIDLDAVAGLTADQIEAISCTTHQSFTEAQVLLFDSAQQQALNFATPLMLDLNGDGVKTTAVEKSSVIFDLEGDGSATQVGWVAPSDGLLVLDVNGDGVINDGTELFGSGTRLADGSTAADGFIALAALDSATDGVIDAQDAAFAQLQVWQDANQDGVSDAGELMSLAALNIASLALDMTLDENGELLAPMEDEDNGNILGLYGKYTTTDGATHQLVDVWLAGVSDLAA